MLYSLRVVVLEVATAQWRRSAMKRRGNLNSGSLFNPVPGEAALKRGPEKKLPAGQMGRRRLWRKSFGRAMRGESEFRRGCCMVCPISTSSSHRVTILVMIAAAFLFREGGSALVGGDALFVERRKVRSANEVPLVKGALQVSRRHSVPG